MINASQLEIANLRIKCVEVFVIPASRAGLEQGKVFELGEQLFKFATEIHGKEAPSITARPKK